MTNKILQVTEGHSNLQGSHLSNTVLTKQEISTSLNNIDDPIPNELSDGITDVKRRLLRAHINNNRLLTQHNIDLIELLVINTYDKLLGSYVYLRTIGKEQFPALKIIFDQLISQSQDGNELIGHICHIMCTLPADQDKISHEISLLQALIAHLRNRNNIIPPNEELEHETNIKWQLQSYDDDDYNNELYDDNDDNELYYKEPMISTEQFFLVDDTDTDQVLFFSLMNELKKHDHRQFQANIEKIKLAVQGKYSLQLPGIKNFYEITKSMIPEKTNSDKHQVPVEKSNRIGSGESAKSNTQNNDEFIA